MATFGEMKDNVSLGILDPNHTAVTESDVANYINKSIAYWKFTRFWFNTVEDSVALPLHASVIPLPSNFVVEIEGSGFTISYSNSRYALAKIDNMSFNNVYSDNGYGRPLYYTAKAGVYEIYPLPDMVYNLKRFYLKDYSALVNNGDTNDFTIYAQDLIEYWAISKLMAERRQDEKMETYYTARAENELRNLMVRTQKGNGTGYLKLTNIL